jgi:hypothetical protein
MATWTKKRLMTLFLDSATMDQIREAEALEKLAKNVVAIVPGSFGGRRSTLPPRRYIRVGPATDNSKRHREQEKQRSCKMEFMGRK